ncbi:prepilin-type N-terminal cleavage/methylation domain-containing protein [Undibacterium sp. RTI2.1]|uniref:type II secretion system protein n=1 Tax=unclassified Undibacterium TaxID=2630295 RepID=UPI002AB53394|nr:MULTISPECIES: prepilin-type N-terminal cleavage/methylation domain-containing protein [unclassified Undibacterium]MDY7539952.1 prepilin-type N-terminal cleavage/methylation domain-containing protein [Undibacterium sp. 5I1]MEB0032809.1 prepilin-type N-terminal cleavage/methylation domain-containing protein [Undibacterium sp. RTI2.1]MEB0116463.1 prepilin-type N-terminal cleavage/methylation domain-containing protein [Undibacterium sp. RTI2.2]MEB0230559.1 prepilin-type N-terminal cleavage/methy
MKKPIYFKHRRGFTILEMIVVIALTSMIVMILLQALQHVMGLHYRFGLEFDRNRQEAMRQSWLSQMIEGLQPDVADGVNQFKGDQRELKGLTNSAFTQHYGAPTPFALRLRYQSDQNRTIIEYREANKEDKVITLFSWTGRRGSFIYLDKKQQAHDTWPPELDHSQQIPNSIQLETDRDGHPWVLALKPAGPVNPMPDPSKIFADVMQ